MHNVCGYEQLRELCAYLSRYTKVTKRTDLRKPSASNGLYTLLALVCLIHKGFLENGFDLFDFRLRQSAEILKYSLFVYGSYLVKNNPP